MSQNSLSCPNTAGATFRTNVNNALDTLATLNSGAAAPGTTSAYMWWADTTTGLLKQRNATNTAWVSKGTIANAFGTFDVSVIFTPDNTVDIGASGATRARDLFLARNAVIGGTITGSSTITGASLVVTGSSGPANGIDLPSANNVGLWANGGERIRLNSSGVGVNTSTMNQQFNVKGTTTTSGMVNISSSDASRTLNVGLSGGVGYLTVESGHALSIGTNGTERINVASAGNIYCPGAGTTASAANAFLNSGSSPVNELLRSTSSLAYKTDVEPLEMGRVDALIEGLEPIWYRSKCAADRKDWSWYGLGAEDVAKLDPRLVHWARPVIGTEEESYTEDEPLKVEVEVDALDVRDGKAVLVRRRQLQVVEDVLPVVDESGAPVMLAEERDARGELVRAARPATVNVPRMVQVKKTRAKPIYGDPVPDGVMYERVAVVTAAKLRDVVRKLKAKNIL